ncbi:progonadoliberin-2 [Corapipo altera]|uniref:progonadoliberin-2 n=1 Tax=Corapipo altera TaxID=415028 RepID=UPI000FD654AD|nr:progonadoliberin-2 [Corapipo altera]
MAPRGSLLLLALLVLSCALPRAPAQHWSHGWYPGGKRDLRTPPNLQVPAPLGRCRPPPCPPRREDPLPGPALLP